MRYINHRLREAKARGGRTVLVFSSLEHLGEHALLQLLRDFCANRELLVQVPPRANEATVPIVLVVSQEIYREYLGVYAVDLLDGVWHFFFV